MLIFRSLGNEVLLTQFVKSSKNSESVESSLNLTQTLRTNKLYYNLSSQINLTQDLSLGQNVSYNLSNSLELSDHVSTGPSEVVINYLQMASWVVVLTPVSNSLNLNQSLSYDRNLNSGSSLNLNQTLGRNITRVRVADNTINLNQRLRYQILRKGLVNLCESKIPFDLEETDNN